MTQVPELLPHPEGGRYAEVFRSAKTVAADQGKRSALTHIYFELRRGETSGFHRVSSDEVWNLYRGDGIRIYQWDGQSSVIDIIELSAATNGYCHVVPARYWQAAEPVGDAVLVGCSVGPGFDFEDFDLMQVGSVEANQIGLIDTNIDRFLTSAN